MYIDIDLVCVLNKTWNISFSFCQILNLHCVLYDRPEGSFVNRLKHDVIICTI